MIRDSVKRWIDLNWPHSIQVDKNRAIDEASNLVHLRRNVICWEGKVNYVLWAWQEGGNDKTRWCVGWLTRRLKIDGRLTRQISKGRRTVSREIRGMGICFIYLLFTRWGPQQVRDTGVDTNLWTPLHWGHKLETRLFEILRVYSNFRRSVTIFSFSRLLPWLMSISI
jgi:hypothetical protein